MKKRLIIKRAILRKALNILGVCTVGLIAACAKYGAEISTFKINLKGVVKSKDSLNTIENIQLRGINSFPESSALTDDKGEFSINLDIEEYDNRAYLNIMDIDGSQNDKADRLVLFCLPGFVFGLVLIILYGIGHQRLTKIKKQPRFEKSISFGQ